MSDEELFEIYLSEQWDDIMTFQTFKQMFLRSLQFKEEQDEN